MYNPELILWLNIAGHAFFMEENKGGKKAGKKPKAMQHAHTEHVDSPSENHY